MRQNILAIRQFSPKFLAFSFLLLAFMGCKKTDQFYQKLQELPQVDNSTAFAYKTAYIIGDTMTITGTLNPQNNLQITIGGKEATIVKTDSVKNNQGIWLDRITIMITDGMQGKAQEVKITSGGYTTLGAAVDIYPPGGLGSFEQSLKSVLIKTFTNGSQNVFLHCQNGKGDIYYYAPATKDFRYIKKDGTETVLYDLSGSIGTTGVSISNFLAGGVDPQGQQLYFSAQTSPSDYVFCKIDLTSKQLTVLNQSQQIAAPYEGVVGGVKMIVSGVYPDSQGRVYLALGFNSSQGGTLPDAIASYNSADGRVSYIYKKLIYKNNFPGMPGTDISFGGTFINFRISPGENLLYAIEQGLNGAITEVYDLDARIKLYTLSPTPTSQIALPNVIAPFTSLQTDYGNGLFPDGNFGLMPLPGKRLQVLMFQFLDGNVIDNSMAGQNIGAQYGFPKWIVFDFTDQRTYAYAPGRFEQNGYIFQPSSNLFPRSTAKDELLNYDENGNLYATANGKAVLIKTQVN